MKIAEITRVLESFAPLTLQETYDNSGLLCGDQEEECTGILCTLDTTEEVVLEAVRRHCNLIVSHHPLIFRGIKQITPSDPVHRALMAAIRNGITLYASHTNLDNRPDGVNGQIGEKLRLANTRVLQPLAGSGEYGAGLIGDIPETNGPEFVQTLFNTFKTGVVRHSPLLSHPIRRVAVCGGSGSFLIARAIGAGADAFVTADLKYHDFFEANGQILLCDIGHFESEQFTTDLFVEILLQKFPTFAVLKSEVKTNPVSYFTGK